MTTNINCLVLIVVLIFTIVRGAHVEDFWCKATSEQLGECVPANIGCTNNSIENIYARALIGCFTPDSNLLYVCCVPDPITPPAPISQECGFHTRLTARILGPGTTAVPRCSWPWMVSIRGRFQSNNVGAPTISDTDQVCAGSLIGEDWVITTGYCAMLAGYGRDANIYNNILVVAGEWDTTKLEGDEQVRTVTKVIIHPGFPGRRFTDAIDLINFIDPKLLEGYNVALLKLSSPVTFNDCVKKACLIQDLNVDTQCGGFECQIIGWGIGRGVVTQTIPLEASVDLYSMEACAAIARYSGDTNHRPQPATACGSALVNGTFPCLGDNGGMVVCNQILTNGERTRWTVSGLISIPDVSLCEDNKPFTVTDLGAVQEWIDVTMATN